MVASAIENENEIENDFRISSVIENENARQREQVKVLIGKGDTDNDLIDALRDEVQKLRQQLHEKSRKTDAQATHVKPPPSWVCAAAATAHAARIAARRITARLRCAAAALQCFFV